jgi:hypothetical protein
MKLDTSFYFHENKTFPVTKMGTRNQTRKQMKEKFALL